MTTIIVLIALFVAIAAVVMAFSALAAARSYARKAERLDHPFFSDAARPGAHITVDQHFDAGSTPIQELAKAIKREYDRGGGGRA